jgi:hypothetical protein
MIIGVGFLFYPDDIIRLLEFIIIPLVILFKPVFSDNVLLDLFIYLIEFMILFAILKSVHSIARWTISSFHQSKKAATPIDHDPPKQSPVKRKKGWTPQRLARRFPDMRNQYQPD